MSNTLSATVNSTNQRMGYRAHVPGREPLLLDYVPPFGDDNGFTPLELILVALATCTGSGVGILLRKKDKTVSHIEVTAQGDRAETHPTVFRTIDLHLTITSPDVVPEEMESVLRTAETTLCPVYVMLAASVEIRVGFTLKNS